MSTELVESSVKLVSCTEAVWNSFQHPLPAKVVIYATDTKKLKIGDGYSLYSELPDGPSIAGIAGNEQNLINVLIKLNVTDEDCIIVIDDEMYKASTSTLTDIINRLSSISNKDTIQTANLDTITSQFSMANTNITTGDNNKLAIVTNHQMSPGITSDEIYTKQNPNPMMITGFDIYTDLACTIKCSMMEANSIYYAKIKAVHDVAEVDLISFSITESNAYVTPTHLGRGVFKLVVGKNPVAGTLSMTGTATYNTDSASVIKTININKAPSNPLVEAVYGGGANDYFYGITTDSLNNVIAVGYTTSEGNYGDALIVKFDSQLNLLYRKRYGGDSSGDYFYHAICDTNNYIYVVGYTGSEGSSGNEIWLLKFDTTLAFIARKYFGVRSYTGSDQGLSLAFKANGNLIVVGISNYKFFLGEFTTSLVNINAKQYRCGSAFELFQDVVLDSNDNIYAVGFTKSEGPGSTTYANAIIVKFGSDFSILAKKYLGGTGDEKFYGVDLDSNNNVYCVGYTTTEGTGTSALIAKFDSSLTLLAAKYYGGAGEDIFNDIAINSLNDILAVGSTTSLDASQTTTYKNALVVKFNTSLNVVTSKVMSGSGTDWFYRVNDDKNGDFVAAGATDSAGTGLSDGLVVRIPMGVPAGTYTGTTLTTLSFTDVTLTIADSAFTTNNSAFDVVTGVTFGGSDSTLTLDNSNLTLKRDLINV